MSKEDKGSKGFRYRTKELDGFDDLKERIIISWGEGTRSWAQWLHSSGNKEIIEILPKNYIKEFPGFYDFILDSDELEKMIRYPDSNREWQRMLSSISGIYAILDAKSGNQYIGSAYGLNGIWGRWSNYIKNHSGGNIELENIIKKDKERYKYFKFSILRVLEPGITKKDVILHESIIKNKLGSRAFGLNCN